MCRSSTAVGHVIIYRYSEAWQAASPALKNEVGEIIGGRIVDDELKNEALAGDELDMTGTSRR